MTCHRVPTRTPDVSNIVVQFKSREKWDVTLKEAKKARLLNSDIGLDNSAPVFVNEHLCPTLKRLLGMATKRKYEHGWKSVWSYNGRIYARQNDNCDSIVISDESDLMKISSSTLDNSQPQ